MAKQLITIGTPGAGGGDPAHAAFKKINDNATELYNAAIPDTEAKKVQARANLGLGKAATKDIVPISEGGTGATTATQAATNLACLGAGQSYKQKKAERTLNARYLNSSGRLMVVSVRMEAPATGLGGVRLGAYMQENLAWQSWNTQTYGMAFTMVVENGHYYGIDLLLGVVPADFSIGDWLELTT